MEITWYGHSCFRLTERNYVTVVTDPFDSKVVGYDPLKLKAEIVTVSHDASGHNYSDVVKGTTHVLTGPGEFEIGGVFITAVQTDSAGRSAKSKDKIRNTVYVFDYDGITIAHLGDLQQIPTQSEIELLGTVNVALVPVGSGGSLNAAKAAEVISMLEPGIVIPMHYSIPGSSSTLKLNPVSKFLKEMGNANVDPQPSLKVTPGSIPEETRVVVLNCELE